MPASTKAELKDRIEIKRCGIGDEVALSLVGQTTFLQTFAGMLDGQSIVNHCVDAHSVDVYRAWLSDENFALWMVHVDPGRAPVGYMVVGPADLPLPGVSRDDIELKRIYLLSKFRGVGIGKRLVATAVEYSRNEGAKRLLLGVYGKNHAAIAFYERVGFKKVGTRKFHVGGQTYDDAIMGMDVTGR